MMRRLAICAAFGAAVALALAGPALAGAEALKWGVVDMDRVADEYQHMQELNREFQDFQRDQERQLQQKHRTRLLTDAERQEYLDLVTMGAPTTATRDRIRELEELSPQREKSLLDLRQKRDRTAEEEAEFQQWEGLYEARMTELAGLQAELQAGRMVKFEELTKLVTEKVTSAIKAVAEQQKLAIVLRKDSVLYGGSDITDPVLAKLNNAAGK